MSIFYNPRRHIPDHVRIIRTELTRNPAYTNGVDTIWLANDLLTFEEDSALAHELVHIDWGHIGHQNHTVEEKVRFETARRLIPEINQRWIAYSHYELADILSVTVGVVQDRMDLMWREVNERLEAKYRLDGYNSTLVEPREDPDQIRYPQYSEAEIEMILRGDLKEDPEP